jgi:hypothetical protein
MKKILFSFLFIFFIFSAFANATCPAGSGPKVVYTIQTNKPNPVSLIVLYFKHSAAPYYGWVYLVKNVYTCATTIPTPHGAVFDKDGVLHDPTGINGFFPFENGDEGFKFVPDSGNGTFKDGHLNCDSGYSATGVAAGIPACMPNPENGTWDDNDDLICNEGYAKNNDNNTCELSSGTNTGGIDTNPTNSWQKALDEANANGTLTTSGNGTQSWTIGGTNYSLTANGVLTTTYPDGSSSVQQVSWSGGSGGSSGGTGTSGGSGTSGGGTGNTTNENNTTPPTDTPIDNTPVANSCTDSALTLQEKMLCELNAGMKKQNSEGAPENSLNQLLKDLKTSNQTDNTALNTNIKSGNTTLTGIKALNETQVNKQTEANTTLDKINDSLNSSELNSESMNFGINKISGTLDGIAEFVTTISDFVKNPSQIGDLMNNKLGEVANKYQTGIMNDSSCGVCPTISIPYHGTNVTLLNQTLLDTYFPIAMMKTIIILTFAFAGFMNFFRSSN